MCRSVDGIPLAIELAASRLRVQAVGELAAGLDDVLGAPGERPARQRTLRATVDWSHDQLDDAERTLFARLSVFAGSWAVDGATAVYGERADDGLAGLVGRSLVQPVPVKDGGPRRFRLLEPLRQYAAEQLHHRDPRRVAGWPTCSTWSGTAPTCRPS